MKSFKQFLDEANTQTMKQDSDEINRQKKHLMAKAKEYSDQAEREKHFGHGGAAQAKAETFIAAAKNTKGA